MKLLKGFSINLSIGLNVFILFLLVFEKQIEIPPLLRVAGRMHPLLLHFPIVLLILAFVFEFFRKYFLIDRPAMEKIVRFLLFSGSLCSAVTVILGLFLSREEGYSGNILLWHKWTGIGVSFLSSLLLWGYYTEFNRTALKIGMLFAFMALLAAGHLGASLTHGENFVLAPVTPQIDQVTDLKNARVYADLVTPVLKEKCFSCHNPDKAKGKLIMTDTASLMKGGASGRLFVSGKSGKSLLVERLLLNIDHKHRMPPKGKPQPDEAEISLIKAWIDHGGSFSARLSDYPEADKIHELAAAIYGKDVKEIYDFASADESVVQKLNNTYRLIAPLALHSPALDAHFFNRNIFDQKSLKEIMPVQTQIVQLNLSGMKAGDPEMQTVASFVNLRQLNLNYTDVSDKGLGSIGQLKNLHALMLTGTRISTRGLAAFLDLSGAKHIYAWNTAIRKKDADSLTAKHPGVRIETGFYDDGQVVLTLSDPQIVPRNAFFRQPFLLKFTHPISGTAIYYTLDGSEPDSVRSPRFKKPVTISSNTLVKARAVKEGWAGSQVIAKYFQHAAKLPDRFSLITFPDPHHKGRGASTLFDLEEGSTDILYASDGKWLGYQNQEFAVELGFEKPVVIKEILLSTLLNVGSGSFPPEEVEVWVWDDGKPPVLSAKIRPEMPGKETKTQQHMISCKLGTKLPVSHVKIIARPSKKLPSWHPDAGKPPWFFIDEILIN